VLGQSDFVTCSDKLTPTQNNFGLANYVMYDPGSGRVFVNDNYNNRLMIFEGSTNSTPAQWMFTLGYE
jgi:hypothetical protein